MIPRPQTTLLLAALAASPTYAATYTFVGPDGLIANWHVPGHWSPNGLPGEHDLAHIMERSVSLGGNARVEDLNLGGDDGWLGTYGNQLRVDDRLQLTGESKLFVSPYGGGQSAVIAGRLMILDNATLESSNAQISVVGETRISSFATLLGTGNYNSWGTLVNNGLIDVRNGIATHRTLNAVGANGLIDLDGTTGGGRVNVGAGKTLVVNGPVADRFDGEITVGQDATIQFSQWLELGQNAGSGVLNLNGSVSKTATLDGTLVSRGQINVAGHARMLGNREFLAGTDLDVAAGGNLVLDGLTRYRGGSYTGAGTILQEGTVQVYDDTTISVATFDLDGGDATSNLIVDNASLHLDVDRVERTPQASDGVDGTIFLRNGHLEVDATEGWRFDGLLRMRTQGVGGSSGVEGAQLDLYGEVRVGRQGGGSSVHTIHAPVVLRPGALLRQEGAGNTIRLSRGQQFHGGTYNEITGLVLDGDGVVHGNTTIATSVFDWDGDAENGYGSTDTFRIKAGKTFAINTASIDTSSEGGYGYDDNIVVEQGGLLAVNTAGAWRLNGDLRLEAGSVSGRTLRNRGRIEGHGITASLINEGSVSVGLESSHGRITVAGDYSQRPYAILGLDLAGTAPATTHDQLRVRGLVELAGVLQLSLADAWLPQVGETLVLLDNLGGDAIVGTFAGLAEGATIDLLGNELQITYAGGTGNDVALTVLNSSGVVMRPRSFTLSAVPEPASAVLIGIGILLIAARKR